MEKVYKKNGQNHSVAVLFLQRAVPTNKTTTTTKKDRKPNRAWYRNKRDVKVRNVDCTDVYKPQTEDNIRNVECIDANTPQMHDDLRNV